MIRHFVHTGVLLSLLGLTASIAQHKRRATNGPTKVPLVTRTFNCDVLCEGTGPPEVHSFLGTDTDCASARANSQVDSFITQCTSSGNTATETNTDCQPPDDKHTLMDRPAPDGRAIKYTYAYNDDTFLIIFHQSTIRPMNGRYAASKENARKILNTVFNRNINQTQFDDRTTISNIQGSVFIATAYAEWEDQGTSFNYEVSKWAYERGDAKDDASTEARELAGENYEPDVFMATLYNTGFNRNRLQRREHETYTNGNYSARRYSDGLQAGNTRESDQAAFRAEVQTRRMAYGEQ